MDEVVPQGLRIINNFITEAEETELLEFITTQTWYGQGMPVGGLNANNRRRTQQYGFLVNLSNGTIAEKLGSFPQEFQFLIDRLQNAGLYCADGEVEALQMLVNEYKDGMGILAHNDSVKLFGPTIVGLSLSAPCVMTMVKPVEKANYPVLLERRSLLLLQGDARNVWHHSIIADQQELIEGKRISITFRTIQPAAMP